MQEQTAQLHRQFLEGQDTAHRTVQLLVEQQQRLLASGAGRAAGAAAAPLPAPPPAAAAGRRSAAAAAAPPCTPSCRRRAASPRPLQPWSTRRTRAAVAARHNGRVEQVLLEVIAEKTGYPAEMLELDMALDADLGIDSIKRVEILSALQERLPDAPPVKPEHLGTLHTLRHIAAFLAGGNGTPARRSAASADRPTPPLQLASSDAVTAMLLEVIAEKTGYPAEMLELDMALDADLGIDSIKRVEILSALQERLPDAPPVKPEHLGTLHTLRHIAAFLAGAPATASERVSRRCSAVGAAAADQRADAARVAGRASNAASSAPSR